MTALFPLLVQTITHTDIHKHSQPGLFWSRSWPFCALTLKDTQVLSHPELTQSALLLPDHFTYLLAHVPRSSLMIPHSQTCTNFSWRHLSPHTHMCTWNEDTLENSWGWNRTVCNHQTQAMIREVYWPTIWKQTFIFFYPSISHTYSSLNHLNSCLWSLP